MNKFLFGVVFCLLATVSLGQTTNYQTHTLFIYGFTKFIQWPVEDSDGDFEIVVLGDSPILAELKAMSEKKKVGGSRLIHVSKISSIIEMKRSHIVYVSPTWPGKCAEVEAKISEGHTLIVTEQAGLGNKGNINFVTKEGKLAFELNQTTLSKHHLKASNELTRMALTN